MHYTSILQRSINDEKSVINFRFTFTNKRENRSW